MNTLHPPTAEDEQNILNFEQQLLLTYKQELKDKPPKTLRLLRTRRAKLDRDFYNFLNDYITEQNIEFDPYKHILQSQLVSKVRIFPPPS